MKEGAIYRPEVPVPHNKCEHYSCHQIFLQFPGERNNFKSVLPPMPVANMAFIKVIAENTEKSTARKKKGSEMF
jgi:hypothetical protein